MSLFRGLFRPKMHEHEDSFKKVYIDVCSTCLFTFLYHNNYLLI
jgi:hypothetical protein